MLYLFICLTYFIVDLLSLHILRKLAYFKPIHVKNEVSKYTGELKKFGEIIFLKDIYLNPSSELTILDSNGSSIIIHESSEGGRRIACAEINRKL